MTKTAKLTLGLIFAIVAAVSLQAQTPSSAQDQQVAEDEAVRRAAATIQMRFKLADAQAAQKKNQFTDAAKLYQEAIALFPYVTADNAAVEAEKKQVVIGFVSTRTQLAQFAKSRGDLAGANEQVSSALKIDPKNESLRNLKAEIDKATLEQQGTVPSPELVATIPAVKQKKIQIATEVQNGKLLYEMGNYDEAEVKLRQVIKQDSGNKAAFYYLDLIKEARYMDKSRNREEKAKEILVKVGDAWIPPNRENLPFPNPAARTKLVYTSKGRQEIMAKLDTIRLDQIKYDDLPLSVVLKELSIEAKKRDPDQVGINFLINPNADATVGAPAGAPDAAAIAAGVPAALVATPAARMNLNEVKINIMPEMHNMRLADVLDAITMVADVPIKYTISEYAIVFSPKTPEAVALFNRTIRVDPNTFIQGLESVSTISLASLGNGGMAGGMGGGMGGGMAGGMGGGMAGGMAGGSTIDIPRITLAGGGTTGGLNGNAGGANGGEGLKGITITNNTMVMNEMVRDYFTRAGVTLTDPGKSIFFNDRTGILFVRASLQDIETIEQVVEVLNMAPPQLTIETKFLEISQDDSRALGFDWFLGNTLLNRGSIGAQGGTAPSFQNPDGSMANPSGIFPGPGIPSGNSFAPFLASPGTIPSLSSDNVLTSGLRQTVGNNSVPAVATISGILTDPQFRVVIRAVEQRAGADLLSAPKVTTLSGRQAHVTVSDLVEIVTSVNLSQLSSSGGTGVGGLSAGGGAIGSQATYGTASLPFGPTLDVLPTVSADGYSVQMVLIPTITEFLGYDDPGQFVPQAQSVGGSTIGIPLTAQLPLPRLRVRQVVTSCNVWDGQTVVLGGLISEDIKKIKDKVPVLGDLPFVGRLFRSESSSSSKKNLMIFVTPTIIDPAGNRLHTDDELPFARSSIPPQTSPSEQ